MKEKPKSEYEALMDLQAELGDTESKKIDKEYFNEENYLLDQQRILEEKKKKS